MSQTDIPDRMYRVGRAFVIALGVALATVQYALDRSVWYDEAMLSLNIISRSSRDLLMPLSHYQVAPILFLEIEKFLVTTFGNSELSLRLLPLLCFVGSAFLFERVSRALSGSRAAALTALALFCISPTILYYSSEIKQYMGDVFVTLLIYYAVLFKEYRSERIRTSAAVLIGSVSILFSHIAVIILFTVGILMLSKNLRRSSPVPLQKTLLPIAVWLAVFSVNYVTFLSGHPSRNDLVDYWNFAFPPLSPLHLDFWFWLRRRATMVFGGLLSFPPQFYFYGPFMLVYGVSLAALLKRRALTTLYLLVFPVLVHLTLSYLRQYPFDLRLILYQAPLYILVVVDGCYWISGLLQRYASWKRSFIVLAIPLVLVSYDLFRQYPLRREEIKPALSFINKNAMPGQTIYVYWGSIPAFTFYKEIGYLRVGESVVFGKEHLDNPGAYEKDVDSLQGVTWVLFSHFYPFDGSHKEEHYIVDRLLRRGRILKKKEAVGASVYLFNLPAAKPHSS